MKIGLRQLLLVVLVAAVFGGGAGYLGGNFETGRVTGQAEVEVEGDKLTSWLEVQYVRYLEWAAERGEEPIERSVWRETRRRQDVERRLVCLEAQAEALGGYLSPSEKRLWC